MEFNEWNKAIIKEFRENAGVVGGDFEGKPLLILHTTGAKSGQARQNPLMYLPEGDATYIFASKAGMPSNPDWYYNIIANPQVKVEVGTETYDATARVVEGEERDRIWTEQKQQYPQFAGYEQNTTRTIPVIALHRA
jgi:deazaflavin-dependent oxidoreductase (nitroreductase family)